METGERPRLLQVGRALGRGLLALAAAAALAEGVLRTAAWADRRFLLSGRAQSLLADAFTEPLSHLPKTLHDLLHVRDVGAGWWDGAAMLWSPATIVHGAKISHGDRKEILAALGSHKANVIAVSSATILGLPAARPRYTALASERLGALGISLRPRAEAVREFVGA